MRANAFYYVITYYFIILGISSWKALNQSTETLWKCVIRHFSYIFWLINICDENIINLVSVSYNKNILNCNKSEYYTDCAVWYLLHTLSFLLFYFIFSMLPFLFWNFSVEEKVKKLLGFKL